MVKTLYLTVFNAVLNYTTRAYCNNTCQYKCFVIRYSLLQFYDYLQLLFLIFFCSLGLLTQLKALYLTYNNFEDGLPDVVGELASLEALDANGCGLTSLPERYARFLL